MYQQRVSLEVKDEEGKIHTLLTHPGATFGIISNVLSTMQEFNKKESEAYEKKLSENKEKDNTLEESEKPLKEEETEEAPS